MADRARSIPSHRAVRVLLIDDDPHDARLLSDAIGTGAFADVKRTRTGGKGYAGVVERARDYTNPILSEMEKK
jgi:hypothetical protein